LKSILTTVSLLLLLALMIPVSGCVLEGESDMVVTQRFCVNFDEHMTSGAQNSAQVCDQFRDQILYYLQQEGIDPADIVDAGIVSATYHVSRVSQDNGPKGDWVISGYATVYRQDDPNGPIMDGPEVFVNQTTQSILDAKGTPVPADLNADGVALLGRALYDLVINGEDPRIIITLESQAIDPVPTEEAPLDFKWRACVTLQMVVHTDPSK